MVIHNIHNSIHSVASFSEAWIEILDDTGANKGTFTSPPSRRRGLKFKGQHERMVIGVASFSEAWIEIVKGKNPDEKKIGRLLLGGVD